MKSSRVAVILPHLGLYGGNLRYLELGRALVSKGVDFRIATPNGSPPSFFDYPGKIVRFEDLQSDPPDVLVASEQNLFDELLALPAKHRFFYFILEKTKREEEIARHPDVTLLANSTGIAKRLEKKYGARATPIVGGINTSLFYPLDDDERERRIPESFRILTHGRFARKRKGTRLVWKAVDSLAKRRRLMELHFFDSATVDHAAGIPPDLFNHAQVRLDLDVPREKLRLLYGSADVFVSAEKKAGWANTAIEAMACGVPVVCTSSGSTDFAIHEETALVVPRTTWHIGRAIRRLMNDSDLRTKLAEAGQTAARRFEWERTAEKFLGVLLAVD